MLKWQTLEVPFFGGQDSNSYEDALPAQKLRRLRNFTWEFDGGLRKVPGWYDITGGGLPEESLGILPYGPSSAVALGKTGAAVELSYQTQLDSGFRPFKTEVVETFGNAGAQADSAYEELNGFLATVWIESGSLKYQVTRPEYGFVVQKPTTISTTAATPRIRKVNGYFHIYWVNTSTNQMQLTRWACATVPALASFAYGAINADQNYAVTTDGTHSYLVWRNASSDQEVRKLTQTGSIDASRTILATATGGGGVGSRRSNGPMAIAHAPDPDGGGTQEAALLLAYRNTAGTFRLRALWMKASDLTDYVSSTADFGVSTPDFNRVTCSTTNTVPGLQHRGHILYDLQDSTLTAPAASYFWEVRQCECSTSANLSVRRTAVHSRLASEASQKLHNDEFLVHVLHTRGTSSLQSQYVLLNGKDTVGDTAGTVVAGTDKGPTLRGRLYASGEALLTGATSTNVLPQVQVGSTSTNTWTVTLPHRPNLLLTSTRGGYAGGSSSANYGWGAASFIRYLENDYKSIASAQNTEGTTYLPGAYLGVLDKMGFRENGFFTFPEFSPAEEKDPGGATPTYPAGFTTYNDIAGVLSPSKSYSYRVHWEWINENGEREQSTALTYTPLTLGAGDDCVLIQVPTLPYTQKPCWLAVYRAGPDPLPTTPYLRVSAAVGGGTNPTYVENNPAALVVEWRDTQFGDTDALSNEPCYLNTGEIDNVPVPDIPSVISTGQSRMFVVPQQNKNVVYYSKVRQSGQLYAFNEDLYMPVPARGGKITAVIPGEDSVTVFRENAIYVYGGVGPNNLGDGGYSGAQTISLQDGCTDSMCIVELPIGIMFRSGQGWKILDKAYRITDVGGPVAEFNRQEVSALWVEADMPFVHISHLSGSGLIYDYTRGVWTEDEMSMAVRSPVVIPAGVEWLVNCGAVTYALANDELTVGTTYKDYSFSASGVAPTYNNIYATDPGGEIDTGWIQLDQTQGFTQMQWWQLQGRIRGSKGAKVRVRVAYNGDDTWVDDFSVEKDLADGKPFDIRKRVSVRKLKSIRFLIEDSARQGQTVSERVSWGSLALRVASQNLIHRSS